MKTLNDFFEKISSEKIKLSQTKNGVIINTTQRNEMKKEIMNALKSDLETLRDKAENLNISIGFANDGLIVAIENPELYKKVQNDIIFKIDIKISGFNYDYLTEMESYETDQKEKAEKKAELLKKKNEKIALNK